MFEWLKGLIKKRSNPPVISMQGLPLEFNGDDKFKVNRNVLRMHRIAHALETEKDPVKKAALEEELKRRQGRGR